MRRTLGQKQLTMTLAKGHTGSTTQNETTPLEKQSQFCLTDEEALTLADYALKIEAHYFEARRSPHADGYRMGEGRRATASFTSFRPGRRRSPRSRSGELLRDLSRSKAPAPVLATGKAVGEKIGTGVVRVIEAPTTSQRSGRARCWSPTRRARTGSR